MQERDAERLAAMQTLLRDVWGRDVWGDEQIAALDTERALEMYGRIVDVLRGGAMSTVAGAIARLLGVDAPKEQP